MLLLLISMVWGGWGGAVVLKRAGECLKDGKTCSISLKILTIPTVQFI